MHGQARCQRPLPRSTVGLRTAARSWVRSLTAVCLCCATAPVSVTGLRLGADAESEDALQTRQGQRQHLPPFDGPPPICVPNIAQKSFGQAQAMVMECIAKAAAPSFGPGRSKDKCECIEDGIQAATQGFKDANCKEMAKPGMMPLNMQKKIFGCPDVKHCDEIKADRKHDKCMEQLQKCMRKQGIDFDTAFLQKRASLLELAEGDPDDDDEDDDEEEEKEKEENDEVCKCGGEALKCVKAAAADTSCKNEKQEEYMEAMRPQKDHICQKKNKNDDDNEDADDSKSRDDRDDQRDG